MFDRIVAFFYAIVLHLVFVVLLLMSMELMSKVNLPNQLTEIQAITVDEREYQAAVQHLRSEKVRRETEAQVHQQALEQEVFDLEAEKTRIARQDLEEQQQREEQRRQAEQEAKQRAEKQRLAKLELLKQQELLELKRKADEEAKRKAAEEQKRLAVEQKRKANEETKRQAAEKKQLAEEEKQQAVEEKQRIAEEQQRKAVVKRKQADSEAEQQRLVEEAESISLAEEAAAQQRAEEARQNAQVSAEQRRANRAQQETERKQLISKVREDIKRKVKNRWEQSPPTGITEGLKCKVRVYLIPDGSVGDVQIIESSGHAAFDSSVIAAYYAASPLPIPKELLNEFKSFNSPFSTE
ncbi:MAG: protein TolA [Beggiatoa sp. IS2]|nr:MAG: protein TolA [Beggiatoa sp. IS2]